MLGFIVRVVSLDLLNAFPGGVVRVHHSVSRLNMEAKSMQVTLQLKKQDDNVITFQVNSAAKVTLRAYWGVDIQIFHHVLRSPWDWFLEAFDKGNLFGSSGCCMLDPMLQLDPNQQLDLPIKPVDLGQAVPRTKYPLVLVTHDESPDQAFTIYVIHIEDKNLMTFPTHILATYLKLPDSRVTHLVPIYSDSDQCVVCIARPATRVVLPCRHANLCGQCFVKLPNSKCPMCRTTIQSFFLMKHEEAEPEEENSVESPALTWRQRLAEVEHRFAMAVGLQEND